MVPTPFWFTNWATGSGAAQVAAAWEARFPGLTGNYCHRKNLRRLLALPVTPVLLEDELRRELAGLLRDFSQLLAGAASEVQAAPPPEDG